MKLYLGAPHVCVMREASLAELRLSKAIFCDIRALFPLFSHEAIASDIFNGATARETITRIGQRPRGHWISGARSYAMIGAVLMHDPILLYRPYGVRAYQGGAVSMARDMRQDLLNLLYHYGVSCACSICCDAALDPMAAPKPLPAALRRAACG
jgi:hypothetical protein